ncbi:hypothetical protein Gogos_015071, partial [Gossypium gossypioides]|nr:hypothetical protein [Gossypium gossypioides]
MGDQIHIITGPLTKIIVPVYRDMKVGAKVLSSIQLVEDVSYGRNIDSIERKVTKTPSEVGPFKVHKKVAKGLWAIQNQGVRIKAIQKGASQNWGKLERRLLAKEMYRQVQ